MFVASRQTVLDAIKFMGSRCCSYGKPNWPEGRCDCKYGIGGPNGKWPTMHETGCGCPELASLYTLIDAMADEEWALLVRRSGGVPSGLFAASPQEMEKRLHAADAAARMAADNISQVRQMLTLPPKPPIRVELTASGLTDEMVERAREAGAHWFREHDDGASSDSEWRDHYRAVLEAALWGRSGER